MYVTFTYISVAIYSLMAESKPITLEDVRSSEESKLVNVFIHKYCILHGPKRCAIFSIK